MAVTQADIDALKASVEALGAAVDGISGDLDDIQAQIDALKSVPGVDLSGLQAAVDAAGQKLAQADTHAKAIAAGVNPSPNPPTP